MKKVLFWDFHGTLTKPTSLWSPALLKALKIYDNNCEITLDDIRKHIKTGFTWHTPEKDFSKLTNNNWWEFMYKRFYEIYTLLGINSDIAKKASRNVKDTVLEIDNYILFPDTMATLEKCINLGYENYILSNNYPELEEIIIKLNLHKYFSGYIISAKIGYDKPRKEIFDYALKISNYPKEAYMIGDNPIADIIGGNNANMKTILVNNTVSCNATYICPSLSEIISVL